MSAIHGHVRRRLKTAGIILVALMVAAGCASPGSYSRIPARYTALYLAPNSESYLIEVVRPVGDPSATRYDFTFEAGTVTTQISTISKTGARSERRRSGEVANRLLQVFRGFDWRSIEAPLPDDEAIARPPDDREVVFKARTAKSYREAQVKLSECAGLRALLAAVELVP